MLTLSRLPLLITSTAAAALAWAVSLRHDLHTQEDGEGTTSPAVFVQALAGASLWRLSAMHERPAASPEGLGCVEVRMLGCAVEVFYRASQDRSGAALVG